MELLEGPLTEEELAERRLSAQVLAAFESLYTNVDGVQDAYATMAAKLAEVFWDEPGVMGIDLMNEPVVLADLDPTEPGLLDAFHANVGEAIRDVAPTMTLVFEPNSIRNFTDAWDVAVPYPFEDAVYSPTSTPMSLPMGGPTEMWRSSSRASKPPRTRRTNTEPLS